MMLSRVGFVSFISFLFAPSAGRRRRSGGRLFAINGAEPAFQVNEGTMFAHSQRHRCRGAMDNDPRQTA